MKTMKNIIVTVIAALILIGNGATASAAPKFGSLADINAACGTRAACETKSGYVEIDTNSDVNPYDVVYDYGEDFNAYVEACDWSLVFDAEYYAETFPMLALQYHDDADLLLAHFQTVGIHEGRQGSEDFNVGAYMYNCKYSVYKAFQRNYAAYYIYYMLNCKTEKNVNTVSADNGKPVKQQYVQVLTWYQAEELKKVNKYREAVGSDPVEFDSEMAAFANYRAYLNAHDGWEAHDWLDENFGNGNGIGGKYISKMTSRGYNFAENTTTFWTPYPKDWELGAGHYYASKSHYDAMVKSTNLYIGISNMTFCADNNNTHSQFDVYLNDKIDTVVHPHGN